jgi:hypothetical protein
MKTVRLHLLISAMALLNVMNVFADEFFPTGTTWTEAWINHEVKIEDANVVTYEIGTDTLVGNTTYKRILIDGKEQGQWLREDDGEIWLLRDDFPQEIMLYHFDWFSYEDYPWWKTDDTTYRQYIQNGELKEDTIHYDKGFTGAMRDGKDRPRISFHQSFLKVDIIRGIGQTTELYKNCCILGSVMPEIVLPGTLQCRLLTFSRNGKLVYDFEEQFDASSFFTRDVPTAGLDVYFFTGWHRMFQYDYQCIDSLVGNNIHISAHYNKQPDDTTHKRAALINMGSFEAGEYKVVLTAVDNSSQLPDIVHEYPFTVKESTVDVPRGLIHTSVANEKEKSVEEAFEEGFIPDRVTPVIDATLEGDSLHITGWLRFQICDHWCYYEIHGDSIYLETVERNNPGVTGGWPLYSIDFKIGPFTGDHCTIQVAHVLRRGANGATHYQSTHVFDFTSIRQPKEDNTISNTIFDLTGRPADGTKKGIYILGGKKVLVK